jgi:DNA adenine methylase
MKVEGTPSPWFGGKWEMPWLLDLFPDPEQIHTYVEPYGGMCGLMLRKMPSPVEVYNDVNSALVTFWKAVRLYPDELARAVELTPISYEEWSSAKAALRELKDTDGLDKDQIVEVARQFIVMSRQSMAGAPGRSWQASVTHSRRGMASTCSAWLNLPETVVQCGQRFKSVQIEHRPAVHVIKKYDTPKTLFYLDPPYMPETCKTGVYSASGGAEMSPADHAVMLRAIRDIEGSAVLSGYDSDLYNKWLDRWGWQTKEIEVPCRSAVTTSGSVAERTTRIEKVWYKYNDGMKPEAAKTLFCDNG